MDGTTHIGGVILGTVDPIWSIAAAADFNGDKNVDILWQNTSTGERYLWLMDGTTLANIVDLGTVDSVWEIANSSNRLVKR